MGANNIIELAKESISKPEDESIETYEVKQREKRMSKHEQNFRKI